MVNENKKNKINKLDNLKREWKISYIELKWCIWSGALEIEQAANLIEPLFDGNAVEYLSRYTYNLYPHTNEYRLKQRENLNINISRLINEKQQYDLEFNTNWKYKSELSTSTYIKLYDSDYFPNNQLVYPTIKHHIKKQNKQ